MAPRILILDNGTNFLRLLVERLEAHGASVKVMRPPLKLGEALADGYIVSGRASRPTSLEERRELLRYYREFYLSCPKPVLSICFGHEVFALSYGAQIRRKGLEEHGLVSLELRGDYPLAPGVRRLEVMQSHRAGVVRLSSCLINYADGPKCPHQVLKHRDKPQFSVQFHPEASPKDPIIPNFVKYCAGRKG